MKYLACFIFLLGGATKLQAQDWKTLNARGQKEYQAGNYQQAATSFKAAANSAVTEFGKEHKNYATTLNNLAFTYQELKDYTQTEIYFIEALSIYRKILPKNNPLLTNSINGLGEFYVEQSNYTKAEPLLVECLTLRKKYLGEKNQDYGFSLNKLGILYQKVGKYTQAETFFTQYLTFTQQNIGKESQNYAAALNNLGSVYEDQAKYIQAETLYLQSLDIITKNLGKKHPNYASSLNNLAFLYKEQGNYTKSETLFIESTTLRKENLGENHPEYASSLNNLALLYADEDNNIKAEPLYVQSLSILAKSIGKNHPYYASTLNNLAVLYGQQGNYTKAEVFLQESIDVKKRILGEKHPDYAASLGTLGELYRVQGKYTQAATFLVQASDIIREVLGKTHPYYGISISNLALLYQIQGNFSQAEVYFKESLSITEQTVGKKHADYGVSLNNLGSLYLKQGNIAKAETLFLETLAIYKKTLGEIHSHNIETLNNLAILYDAQTNDIKASTYYQQASTLLVQEVENNFTNLSEKEKELFLKTTLYKFDRYNSFTLRASQTIPTLTAWSYNNSLATKGLIFASSQKIRETILNSGDKELQQLYEKWKNLRSEYAKALQMTDEARIKQGISIKNIQEAANEVEKTLSKKSNLFAKANNTTKYTWKDVQKNLKVGEAIVEVIRVPYFASKKMDSTIYMALVVTPETKNQPEMVVLSNGKEMDSGDIAYYKNGIKFKKEDKVSYNTFWKDIQAKIKRARKVYFVPDGVYHQLNLSTLQNPITKQYVREETTIQLLSSSKDLIKYNQNASKQTKNFKDYQIHLFGYPDYAGNGVQNLPSKQERSVNLGEKLDASQRFFDKESGTVAVLEGTRVEINSIGAILVGKGIKTTLYLASEAEEATIKTLKSPDILHIATHGFFLGNTEDLDSENSTKFRENPLLKSGLLLRDAEKGLRGEIKEGEDGILTAQEALNLSLEGTELVVMSACETGLGEIKNGEGVYGLQRAFQQAGARTILMSLWKVDDAATQEMMTLFYTNLASGKNKRDAFNLAQETLYKKYKEPYYWGAFVMVGE
jgi:CHAT domain-containing protein